MLVRGFRLAKAGQRDQAYEVFNQVVKLDPNSEYGWLWRATTTDDMAEAYVCLQRVLSINPNNEKARRGIERIQNRVAGENVDLTGGMFDASRSGFTGSGRPETDFAAAPATQREQAAPPPPPVYGSQADVPFDPNNFLSGGSSQAQQNPYAQPTTYGYQENAYAPGPTAGGYGAQPEAPYGAQEGYDQEQGYEDGAYPLPTAEPASRRVARQPQRRRGGLGLIPILILVLLLLVVLFLFLNRNNGGDNNAVVPAITGTPDLSGTSSVPLLSDTQLTGTAQAATAQAGGINTTPPAGADQTATAQAGGATGNPTTAPQTTPNGPAQATSAAPANTSAAAPATTQPPASTGPATQPTAVPPASNQPKPLAYSVAPGNNLPAIARAYNTSPEAIVAANKGRTYPGTLLPIVGLPNTLYAHSVLIIPVNRPNYRGQGVIIGENNLNSLQDVANKYGKKIEDLLAFNGIATPGDVKKGDAILLPQ